MSLYFVGIDISKYKHDCCIISATDQKVISKFTIKNDKMGFEELITTFNSLSSPENIRINAYHLNVSQNSDYLMKILKVMIYFLNILQPIVLIY